MMFFFRIQLMKYVVFSLSLSLFSDRINEIVIKKSRNTGNLSLSKNASEFYFRFFQVKRKKEKEVYSKSIK